ncbi:MAG: AAA family ATPase [Sphingomonadales bacterium]|nr:AAA family ATPase [Sphingomonadales bacterium]
MYDQFYGLTGRPFQLTPDPQYYFESATHRKALSYLGYGLAQGEGFIVITGEVGAGKSTLVAHLMQSIDKSRLSAATIVTSHLDGKDMVQMAAESFGISSHGKDKAETLKAIESYLHGEARSGRRCLLIVDEAQNLTIDAVEELRMLSNFQLGSQALLQIFLLGQPEFRDLVQNSAELEQLRQRIIATHHLDAMEADEVEPYIIHRLTRAGWNGNPQLSSDAFTALYAETEGVPRRLNTLMSRVMLMGAVEQLHRIDGDLVKAVIADMAGKPFEYNPPVSAKAPPVAPVEDEERVVAAEPVADAMPEEVEAEIEEAFDVIHEEPVHVEAVTAANEDINEYLNVSVLENSPELLARLDMLEKRVAEQEDALRHVLSMMIDWMDRETSLESKLRQANRAA